MHQLGLHPRSRASVARSRRLRPTRWTSLLIGVVGAALLIFTSCPPLAPRQGAHGMETEPFALFVGKNLIFAA